MQMQMQTMQTQSAMHTHMHLGQLASASDAAYVLRRWSHTNTHRDTHKHRRHLLAVLEPLGVAAAVPQGELGAHEV